MLQKGNASIAVKCWMSYGLRSAPTARNSKCSSKNLSIFSFKILVKNQEMEGLCYVDHEGKEAFRDILSRERGRDSSKV